MLVSTGEGGLSSSPATRGVAGSEATHKCREAGDPLLALAECLNYHGGDLSAYMM